MATVLALSGGVGGAKLSLGLMDMLSAEQLAIVANTADDFEHLGLHICPDIDTLLYTLSGRADPVQGWGLADESWEVMAALEDLGGATWFRLGDRDLATHLWRSQALADGDSLSAVTDALRRRLGISCRILPMSDDAVRTIVHSAEGDLPFQHYFVRRRCEPAVSGFSFAGLEQARPAPEVIAWLGAPDLQAIVICPSNPFVSVDPILKVPGLTAAIAASPARVVAVSPIVGGLALKGPAAKMMAELGLPVTAQAVAEHYQGLIDTFVLDDSDAALAAGIEQLGVEVLITPTIMRERRDKQQLARRVLGHCAVQLP
jgi:LPPG:FO 2-phospho-L-lactate transferase